eukprot:6185780-Pleurochrysis_carterae.AAC.6
MHAKEADTLGMRRCPRSGADSSRAALEAHARVAAAARAPVLQPTSAPRMTLAYRDAALRQTLRWRLARWSVPRAHRCQPRGGPTDLAACTRVLARACAMQSDGNGAAAAATH